MVLRGAISRESCLRTMLCDPFLSALISALRRFRKTAKMRMAQMITVTLMMIPHLASQSQFICCHPSLLSLHVNSPSGLSAPLEMLFGIVLVVLHPSALLVSVAPIVEGRRRKRFNRVGVLMAASTHCWTCAHCAAINIRVWVVSCFSHIPQKSTVPLSQFLSLQFQFCTESQWLKTLTFVAPQKSWSRRGNWPFSNHDAWLWESWGTK